MNVIGPKPIIPALLQMIRLGALLFAWMFCPVLFAVQTVTSSVRASAGPSHSDDALPPGPASPAFPEAVALIQQHAYARAEENLRSVLQSHPDWAEAHFLLGYVLYREGKADASLAEYTAGARLRKPLAGDLAVVAMDYIVLYDYADADKWLSQAISWEPGNPLYWYYLGRTKYVENRFQEAIDAFTKCLALRPGDVKAEYNLGLAYEGNRQNENAVAAYQMAIAWQQRSPHPDAQPYLDLGIFELAEGHAAEAVDNLQMALSLDRQNPRIHEELGRAYERINRLLSAQAELETAVELAPNVSSLHFELGRIYQKQGLRAKAQEQFARCTALNASHSTDGAETPNADVQPQLGESSRPQ